MNDKLKEFQSHGRLLRENRATGRTSRMLLRALLKASEGTSVALVFNSEAMSRDGYKRMRSLVAASFGASFIKKFEYNHIQFMNGTCIAFTTVGKLETVKGSIIRITGSEPTIEYDHYQGAL